MRIRASRSRRVHLVPLVTTVTAIAASLLAALLADLWGSAASAETHSGALATIAG